MRRFDSCGWENDVLPTESFILEYNRLLWQGELFLHGFNEIPDEPYCCLSGDPFEDPEQPAAGEVAAVTDVPASSTPSPSRKKREDEPSFRVLFKSQLVNNLYFLYLRI